MKLVNVVDKITEEIKVLADIKKEIKEKLTPEKGSVVDTLIEDYLAPLGINEFLDPKKGKDGNIDSI